MAIQYLLKPKHVVSFIMYTKSNPFCGRFRTIYLFIFFLFANFNIIAQDFCLNPDSIDFQDITVNIQSQKYLWFVNKSDSAVNIENVQRFNDYLTVSPQYAEIPANDSLLFTIKITASQNINYNTYISFESHHTSRSLIAPVKARAFYQDTFYHITQNLWAEDLKSALHTLVDNHTSLGYNLARDRMFDTIDNQNGHIECVYTGRIISADNRTQAQNQGFNTEHTWPQGAFDQDEPMRSDIFHLFPTDASANSARASYPFGNAVTNITWNNGGSALGQDSAGQIVFEPRDVHKGNASRAVFYFLIRYGNIYDYYNDGTWHAMHQYHEDILRIWHLNDLPDQQEIDRNNSVFNFQSNRNPFIDHPEFMQRISTLVSTAQQPVINELNISPATIDFKKVAVGDSAFYYLSLINTGNTDVIINNVSNTDSTFSSGEYDSLIQPGTFNSIRIKFVPRIAGQIYHDQLEIRTTAGNYNIPVSGQGSTMHITEDKTYLKKMILVYNYPNPFNSSTIFHIFTKYGTEVVLEIYNSAGQNLGNIYTGRIEPGYNSILWNASELHNLSSGLFYAKISSSRFVKILKILYIK